MCSWFSATIVSPAAGGVRGPAVLSVTAGVPWAMKGDWPYRLNGKARSISWESALGRSGVVWAWLWTLASAVATSVATGVRGVSPAKWR